MEQSYRSGFLWYIYQQGPNQFARKDLPKKMQILITLFNHISTIWPSLFFKTKLQLNSTVRNIFDSVRNHMKIQTVKLCK